MLTPDGHGEPEGRTFARTADHADLAAHHFRQLARDGKAQASATIGPCRGVVGLGERFENAVGLIRGDSRAAVTDLGIQHRGIALGFLQSHLDRDVARRGEFNGIAQKIDQDLPKPVGIAQEGDGYIAGDVRGQGQTFGNRIGALHVSRVFNQFTDVDRPDHEFHLSDFNLGVVENGRDQVQHDFARLMGDIRELALFRRQMALLQQLDRAKHAVHGCAKFMAHIRQEPRFRRVRRFRRFFGGQQLPHEPLVDPTDEEQQHHRAKHHAHHQTGEDPMQVVQFALVYRDLIATTLIKRRGQPGEIRYQRAHDPQHAHAGFNPRQVVHQRSGLGDGDFQARNDLAQIGIGVDHFPRRTGREQLHAVDQDLQTRFHLVQIDVHARKAIFGHALLKAHHLGAGLTGQPGRIIPADALQGFLPFHRQGCCISGREQQNPKYGDQDSPDPPDRCLVGGAFIRRRGLRHWVAPVRSRSCGRLARLTGCRTAGASVPGRCHKGRQ